jgi:hypothetical protein
LLPSSDCLSYRFCQGGFFRVLHIFVIEDKAPLRTLC